MKSVPFGNIHGEPGLLGMRRVTPRARLKWAYEVRQALEPGQETVDFILVKSADQRPTEN